MAKQVKHDTNFTIKEVQDFTTKLMDERGYEFCLEAKKEISLIKVAIDFNKACKLLEGFKVDNQ